MKRIFLPFTIFAIALMLLSCNASKRALRNGDYDRSVYLSWKKVKRNANKQKQVLVLEEAFKKAQQRDMEEISLLKQENKSENWDNIYELYNGIRRRQTKVKSLPQLYVKKENNRKVVFPQIDVDAQLLEAKKGAANYSYERALKYLATKNRNDARKAYYELSGISKYYKDFAATDSLKNYAYNAGLAYVLVQAKNQTGMPLPPGYEDELKKLNINELNRKWSIYETREAQNGSYDYIVSMNVKRIDASPERLSENRYVDKKTIQDGWEYVLDKNGNVMKDSLGNDIKNPKYKTIFCEVIERIQQKSVMVTGQVEFINLSNKQVIKSVPISSENRFDFRSAIAQGDLNALSPESLEKIKNRLPAPFPPTGSMVAATLPLYKQLSVQAIRDNGSLLDD